MADNQFNTFEEFAEHAGSISDIKERIDSMLLEWQSYIYTHPQQMLEMFEAFRNDAGKGRDQHAESLATLGIGRCLSQLGQYDDSLGAYQSALARLRGIGDTRWVGYVLRLLGIVRMTNGEYVKALEHFDESLECYRSLNLKAGEASVLNNISSLQGTCGNYERALEIGLQALECYREAGDKDGEAHILLTLGFLNDHLDQTEQAETQYNAAREIWKSLGDEESEAKVCHNIGELYLEHNQANRSEPYLQQALDTFRRHNHRRGIAKGLGSFGRMHQELGDHNRALEYYEDAIKIAREINDPNTLALLTANAGGCCVPGGAYKRGLKLLQEARGIAQRIGLRALEQGVECDLAECHAALGNFEEAYKHSHRSEGLLTEVLGEQQRKALSELQVRYDLASAVKEKEIYRLRNEQVEMIMEQRSKELAGMALHLVEKAELIESFSKQVKKIARSAQSDARKMAERLLENIDQQSLSEDWSRFEQQFDKTQGNFVQSLLGAYSELTPTEARICSLLKMGLSTKEIASLQNASERNIESHRYNIRRKLDMETNQTIVSFLRGFEENQATRRAVSEDTTFTVQLSSRFPDLSEAELKVCTLTRNGLTTKEIAEFLGISERTVETHRYKIRRKMGLEKGQNFQAFLKGLS